MDDAVDIAIIDRVMKKMNLPDDRPEVDSETMQSRIERALSMLKPDVPNEFCQRIFQNYFTRFQATDNECLQAWALFSDYKSMAALYGIEKAEGEKVWTARGLALTT